MYENEDVLFGIGAEDSGLEQKVLVHNREGSSIEQRVLAQSIRFWHRIKGSSSVMLWYS